jgi:hypothetical protein
MPEPRWVARPMASSGYRVIIGVLLALPPMFALEVLFEGATSGGLIVLGLVSVASLAGALAVWRRSKQSADIWLEGDGLVLVSGSRECRHALGPGSLHAARHRVPGYGASGTVVFLRFGEEAVTVGMPALLPDARYAPEPLERSDLWVEAGAAALLARLRPYVMPADPSTTPNDAIYTIPLHRWSQLGLPTEPDGFLMLTGMDVRLVLPTTTITAAPAEVQTSVGGYDQPMGDAPVAPWCPCLRLQFPGGHVLHLGASTLDGSDTSWWGREAPASSRPEYLVGEAELAHVADALGVPRNR